MQFSKCSLSILTSLIKLARFFFLKTFVEFYLGNWTPLYRLFTQINGKRLKTSSQILLFSHQFKQTGDRIEFFLWKDEIYDACKYRG